MTLLPILMMFPACVFACLALSNVGFEAISLALYALVCLSFAFMWFLLLKKMLISRYVLLFFFFLLLLFSLTVMLDGDINGVLYSIFELTIILFAFHFYRNRPHVVVIGMTLALSLCVYLGLLHFFTHPDLWIVDDVQSPNGYLLGGNYNGMGVRMLLALTFSMVCIRYSKLWIINFIGVAVASFIPLIITSSATATVGFLLFFCGCLMPSLKLKKLFFISLLLFFLFFQCLIVFSGKGIEHNDFAVYIIEDVLEKDITFTSRIYLWDQAMQVFSGSPIIGYGFVGTDWYKSHVNIGIGTGPHNMLLSILINGGVVLFIYYIYLSIISYRRASTHNDSYSWNIRLSIVCIMIMLLLEYQSYFFPMTLFILAYYYPNIREETITRNEYFKDDY